MDRLERLERKKLEAEARLRKAQKETREQERKIRTRCLLLVGSGIVSELKKYNAGSEEQRRLLQIVVDNLSDKDIEYLNENQRFLV